MSTLEELLNEYEAADQAFWHPAISEQKRAAWRRRANAAVKLAAASAAFIRETLALQELARLAVEDIERSTGQDIDLDIGMSEVFEARDNAGQILARLAALGAPDA